MSRFKSYSGSKNRRASFVRWLRHGRSRSNNLAQSFTNRMAGYTTSVFYRKFSASGGVTIKCCLCKRRHLRKGKFQGRNVGKCCIRLLNLI